MALAGRIPLVISEAEVCASSAATAAPRPACTTGLLCRNHLPPIAFACQHLKLSSRVSFHDLKLTDLRVSKFRVPASNVQFVGTRSLFTGIVEEMGQVRELRQLDNGGYELKVEGKLVLEDVKLGDSIAVNGTCLTVTSFDSDTFCVGLAPETLRKTCLGETGVGSLVNLERSLQPSSRMGGHFVQGHVDGTGTIVSLEPEGDSLWVKVKTSPELLRYIVSKGYIAVDGTSLTVVETLDAESCFTFMLVAYTQKHIVIPHKHVGSKVNLEVDIVGKYVERLLQGYSVPASA